MRSVFLYVSKNGIIKTKQLTVDPINRAMEALYRPTSLWIKQWLQLKYRSDCEVGTRGKYESCLHCAFIRSLCISYNRNVMII